MNIDSAALSEYLQERMRQLNSPGLAVAIVQDGRVVYLRGLGIAGPAGRAMTPHTPLILGSLSKSFTALAAMQLVETGVLALDEPITRYLPWFQMADARAQDITCRHLLLHISGIARFTGRALLSRPHDQGLEQTVRALKSEKLVCAPGERFEYSNVNYSILSLLIETISEMPYAQYIQQHIFRPLGMQHSHVALAAAQADGLAQGYSWWYGRPVAIDAPYLTDALGAAFLASSAADMARWLLLHLDGQVDGVRILDQTGLDELHRPQTLTHKPGVWAAFGWRESRLGGERIWHHGGEVSNFRAEMMVFPDQHVGLVVLANCNHGLVAQLGLDQIAADLARFLFGLPAQKHMSLRSFAALEIAGTVILLSVLTWLWRIVAISARMTAGGLAAFIALVSFLLLVLLWLPKAADMPWRGLRLYVPDLGNLLWWLSLVSLILASVALLRWIS